MALTSYGAQRWALGPDAFEKLLRALDPDREAAGKRYEAIRAGLVRLFEWRGCEAPDALADVTIDRVCRKIEAGEPIEPARAGAYFHGVARNVLKEHYREVRRQAVARESLPSAWPGSEEGFVDEHGDRRLGCLGRCLEGLAPDDRGLVAAYYRSEKGQKIADRRELAARLGISHGNLRIRAYRIRRRLEICVDDCLRARHDGRLAGQGADRG